MIKSISLAFIFTLVFCIQTKAQTLSQQYDSTVTKSNNFQNYKVINKNQIATFWKNVNDTLKNNKSEISQLKQNISNSKKQLASVKSELAFAQNNLINTQNSVNSIAFLGLINLNKSTYTALMWSLILVLLVACAILFYLAMGAKKEAKYRIKLFEDTNNEFKNFKVNANEKEKKLARELQDERNKLDQSQIR